MTERRYSCFAGRNCTLLNLSSVNHEHFAPIYSVTQDGSQINEMFQSAYLTYGQQINKKCESSDTGGELIAV